MIHQSPPIRSAIIRWTQRAAGSMIAVALSVTGVAQAQGNRILRFHNQCSQTVWIGANGGATQACGPGNSCPSGQACLTNQCFWTLPLPASGSLELAAGASARVTLSAPPWNPPGTPQWVKWNGNIYGSTGCNSSGQNCQTGVCVGGSCAPGTGPVGPTTLAELTLLTNGPDNYDISMINGVNLPMSMEPTSGQTFGTPPSGLAADYFCGAPGKPQPSNPALQGCTWQFDPKINGTDQSPFLQMVTPGGNACTKNSACTSPQVCGLAMTVGTTTVSQVCGQQIGWWTADEVCGYTNSGFGAPFNCSATVSGQGNNANLYLCNGANTCYNSSATATCCGCPQWTFNGKTLPAALSCGASNKTTNPSWNQIAQPWAQFAKQACPTAYSFPYDDATSTFTCAGTNPAANAVEYTITYCPGGKSGVPPRVASRPKK